MSELYDPAKHGATGKPAAVPWYRYASKAVAAAIAAVVVNAAIIIAAVEDGQVTTTEKVTIGLAILGSLGIPGAVWKAPRNTYTE